MEDGSNKLLENWENNQFLYSKSINSMTKGLFLIANKSVFLSV